MAKEIDYSKRKTVWSVIMTLLCVVLCIAIILIAFPVSTYIPRVGIDGTDYDAAIAANKYISKDVKVVAHRGGSYEAPENTLLAYKNLLNTNGVEGTAIEIDVRLTKDGYLAVAHDDTLDRTSNCVQLGYKKCAVSDYAISELKQFNLGYNFQDKESGEYVYRDADEATLKDLRICTLQDVLSAAKAIAEGQGKKLQDITFYVDIKDGGDRGCVAATKVYNALKAYGILGNTVVECFTDSVALYIDSNINTTDVRPSQRMIRSASDFEIWQFYFCCMFNIDLSKKGVKYSVLSMPYRWLGVSFAKAPIVDYAHKYGIAVNYWTINDPVELAYMESVGADAVITDNAYRAIRMFS